MLRELLRGLFEVAAVGSQWLFGISSKSLLPSAYFEISLKAATV